MKSSWHANLRSAMRTAIACTIVGCTALYGPQPLCHQLRFPSVAYVTVILIVPEATLGDSLRGCWHALCATLLVVPPSILWLWLVQPSRLAEFSAGLLVGASAFFVALPKSFPLLLNRIAFVQIVIIYVGAAIHSQDAGVVMHPIHVAACTALGALASLLALLLPYPWLAQTELKKLSQLYTENASERTSMYMKAFFSEDNATADDFISQSKPFAETGAKLLHQIKQIEEGVKWERPRIRDIKRSSVTTRDRLDGVERAIKGMEMALTSIDSFPINEEISGILQSAKVQENLKLAQAMCFLPFDDAMTLPERKEEVLHKSLPSLATISPTLKDLPSFFFLSCIELVLSNSTVTPLPSDSQTLLVDATQESRFKAMLKLGNFTKKARLVYALKCSLSLGLAAFLGLIFNKPNGYWSGLTIAISIVTGRQPTFTVANARLQGTAIGTVYGILGACLLHKMAELRFVILLPWIIFTSLLRHSKFYGEAGAVSSVIGALLILGRENFGPRHEFAIARLTEVAIGLFCLIMVEVLLQPTRAATLVKHQFSQCLGRLDEFVHQVSFSSSGHKGQMSSPNFLPLRETHKILKSHVHDLKKMTKIAESEPDFWFLPFRASCCNKLQHTLSRMVDLLQIMVSNMEFLDLQVSQRLDFSWRDFQDFMNTDLGFLENVSSSIKRLEKMASIKSFSVEARKEQLQEGKVFEDLELGKIQASNMIGMSSDAVTTVLNAFLRRSNEIADKLRANKCEEEFIGKTLVHLNSLAFCIRGFMNEIVQVEKGIKEMIRSENPSTYVDFYRLCKLDKVHP